MLRTIPSSALAYARDGVLSASAIGEAARSERIEGFARRRAREMIEQAQAECDRMHALSAAEGFAQGYGDAIGALVPIISDVLRQEDLLVESVLGRVLATLRESLQDLDFEAEQVAKWCALQAEQGDTRMALHLPAHRVDLAEALSAHPGMAQVRVQFADVELPVLCVGRRVFEFDSERQLLREVRQIVDSTEYGQWLERVASDYGANLVAHLRRRSKPTGLPHRGEEA